MNRVTLQGGYHDNRSFEIEYELDFLRILNPTLDTWELIPKRRPEKWTISVYRKQIIQTETGERIVYVFDHEEERE